MSGLTRKRTGEDSETTTVISRSHSAAFDMKMTGGVNCHSNSSTTRRNNLGSESLSPGSPGAGVRGRSEGSGLVGTSAWSNHDRETKHGCGQRGVSGSSSSCGNSVYASSSSPGSCERSSSGRGCVRNSSSSTACHSSSCGSTRNDGGASGSEPARRYRFDIIPKYDSSVNPLSIWDIVRTLKDNTIYGRVKLCQNKTTQQLVAVKMCEREYVDKRQSVKGSRVQEDVREEVRLLRFLHEQIALLAHTVEGVCSGCGVTLVSQLTGLPGQRLVAGAGGAMEGKEEDWLAAHKGVSYGNVDVGLVRLVAEAEDPTNYWTVLEFMPEGDAFDLVSRVGALPQAKQHFRRVACAVGVMHSLGVAHLDLSLENCLVGADGALHLCDLGLARECNAESMVYERIGKLQYWAPEIFAGQPARAFAADVWSLGVMLFLMLVGAPPYKLPALSDKRFEYIFTGRLSHLLGLWKKEIDPSAKELMQSMLSPEKTRISLTEVLRHPFLLK